MELLWLIFVLPGCICAVTVFVPSVVEVKIGESGTVQCKPTSNGSPKYNAEWFTIDEDGVRQRIASYSGKPTIVPGTEYTDRVSVNSDFSLVIRDVQVSDERKFFCKVSAGSEGSSEGVANLKVYDPPEIPELVLTQGILSVTESEAVEIGTCISRNSYPAPSIQWYKNQKPLDPPAYSNKDLYTTSRTVTEASGLLTVSSTLYLRPTKQDNDARFACRVKYSLPGGTVNHMESQMFNLSLHYYTEDVQFQVRSVLPIKEGDDVTLRCVGDGFPPPSYIIEKIDKAGTSEELYSGSDEEFTIKSVSRDQSGLYRCHALDFDTPPEILLVRELNVSVHYLNPLSVQQPEVASLGMDVQLICLGDGSETPHLAWRKGNELLSDSSRHRLRNVTYYHSGVYTCVATVSTVPGLVKEQSVTVTVKGAPQIEPADNVIEANFEGEAVTLTCSALGHPEPEITWNPPELQASQTKSGHQVKSTVTVKASSKLVNAISCTAKNSLGSNEKKFTLKISSLVLPSSPPAQEQSSGSSTAIIAVVVCVLLLLLVVALFYFLQKKGKLTCGSSEKQSL
ncbi:hypothetical protein GDO86_012303 [Hymenochirus boettgeri]|nr:hypothetical protein GDO86_012303 [Hymenochirus boettgeri]